jgi:hypothetical protein
MEVVGNGLWNRLAWINGLFVVQKMCVRKKLGYGQEPYFATFDHDSAFDNLLPSQKLTKHSIFRFSLIYFSPAHFYLALARFISSTRILSRLSFIL